MFRETKKNQKKNRINEFIKLCLKKCSYKEAQMTKSRGAKIRINIFSMITIFTLAANYRVGVINMGVDKKIFYDM